MGSRCLFRQMLHGRRFSADRENLVSRDHICTTSRTSCCGIKPAVSDIDRIISLISRDNTLKIGDLILIPYLAGESIVLAPGQEIKADCGSKHS